MRIKFALTLWILSFTAQLAAQSVMPVILSMRQRAELRDRWTQIRLQRLVSELMGREGIDLWLIVCREYNEDPLFRSMAPANEPVCRPLSINT